MADSRKAKPQTESDVFQVGIDVALNALGHRVSHSEPSGLTKRPLLRIKVVNMVPRDQSGETNQDCMPFLTVNSENPSQLIGTACTYDNDQGCFASQPQMTQGYAPIFISQDGGDTWHQNNIVPTRMPFSPPSPTSEGGAPVPGYWPLSVGFGASGTFYAAGRTYRPIVFYSVGDMGGPLSTLGAPFLGNSLTNPMFGPPGEADFSAGTSMYLQSVAVEQPAPKPTSRYFVAYQGGDFSGGNPLIARSLDVENDISSADISIPYFNWFILD